MPYTTGNLHFPSMSQQLVYLLGVGPPIIYHNCSVGGITAATGNYTQAQT